LKSCREEKSPALFFPSFWFPGNLKGQDTTIQWHLQSRSVRFEDNDQILT